MVEQSKCDKKVVIKLAGAFIAWVIGSGFATGQEVLQFMTSYGYKSYAVVLISLIGFIAMGQVLLTTGFDNKSQESFNHFKYFCGERLGTFYSWMIPLILVLLMSVLISGAGATLHEYYGVNSYIGSAIVALLVLSGYLIGFERLIGIVSFIGPIVIAFLILVGIFSIFTDFNQFGEVHKYESILSQSQSAPHWIISSVLYLSLNILTGSTYFTMLGITADNKNEAKYGALFGAIALVLSIGIINTAILLNAENIALLEIPVLFLARKISYLLGAIFSIILLLGMFAACSAVMWTVCSRFKKGGEKGNRMFAVGIAIFVFIIGLFPFSGLVAMFYPFIGYIGLVFIGRVVYTGIKTRYILGG